MTRISYIPGASRELEIHEVIASGGMATIAYATQSTAAGSIELVVKRPHARFASDSDFVDMFMDEAQLSIRIRHANVIRTLGVLEQPALALVLEYVPGESLHSLLKLSRRQELQVPVRVATALIAGALHGLHAAHHTCGEDGERLHIVHRDVTPENILVGSDGVARVFDFGIAKAVGKLRHTPSGELKGKLAYIAPEQVTGHQATLHTDVYSAAVVLWEALGGRSLFGRPREAATIDAVMRGPVPSLCEVRRDVPAALDAILARALSREPATRYESAQAMARALETEVGVASQSQVMDWIEQLAGERLRQRQAHLQALRAARHAKSGEVALARPSRPAPTPLTAATEVAATEAAPAELLRKTAVLADPEAVHAPAVRPGATTEASSEIPVMNPHATIDIDLDRDIETVLTLRGCEVDASMLGRTAAGLPLAATEHAAHAAGELGATLDHLTGLSLVSTEWHTVRDAADARAQNSLAAISTQRRTVAQRELTRSARRRRYWVASAAMLGLTALGTTLALERNTQEPAPPAVATTLIAEPDLPPTAAGAAAVAQPAYDVQSSSGATSSRATTQPDAGTAGSRAGTTRHEASRSYNERRPTRAPEAKSPRRTSSVPSRNVFELPDFGPRSGIGKHRGDKLTQTRVSEPITLSMAWGGR
ncbi:MAG: serine/threonine-protein kinase [Polyangiales bacterium]